MCFFSPGVILLTKWAKNFVRGLFLTEIKSYSAISKWTINWSTSHLPRHFFPKIFQSKFWNNIFFSIVERSNNYVSGDKMYSPRKKVFKSLGSLHTFLGGNGRTNFLLKRFCMEIIFYGKGRFQRVKFSGEILRWLICQNFYIKVVYMSGFHFDDSILHVEMLMVIPRGKFSPVLYCPEDNSMRKGILLWKWSQVSWRYLRTIRN